MSCTLFQGDCLEVLPTLERESIDLVLTDLPYGTTNCKWDSIIPFDEMWEQVYRLIKPNAPIVLFCDEPFSSRLRLSNLKDWKYDWVWIKEGASNIFNAKYRPLKYHENVAVFYKEQPKYYPNRIMIPRISRRVEEGQRTGWDGGFYGEPMTCECKYYGVTEGRKGCSKFKKRITKSDLLRKVNQLEKELEQLQKELNNE